MIVIRHWLTQAELYSADVENIKEAVTRAVASGANLGDANLGDADLGDADLGDADLGYANLRGANLRGANLGYANLRGANLGDANLGDANLGDANLRGANLGGANLGGANLGDANLRGANLRGANLGGANLRDVRLSTGELYSEYLAVVVPALLTAGGKSLDSLRESWTCHSWNNCPMAQAFSAQSLDGVPLLLRPRAEQFVQLFDAGQIPFPVAATEETKD